MGGTIGNAQTFYICSEVATFDILDSVQLWVHRVHRVHRYLCNTVEETSNQRPMLHE